MTVKGKRPQRGEKGRKMFSRRERGMGVGKKNCKRKPFIHAQDVAPKKGMVDLGEQRYEKETRHHGQGWGGQGGGKRARGESIN